MTHDPPVRYYDTHYGQFATRLYAGVRAEAFGEDIGQNGWISTEEQDLFIRWLALDADARLLDVACGSGGPTLRIARQTGCRVHGIDLHPDAVAAATSAAREQGLAARATFEAGDAGRPLAPGDGAFDALICVDAVNHLPDRPAVFREWARVLKPGGRLVVTDPIVVTGALSSEEIAARSSIGFFLFVPAGHDERLPAESGFDVLESADRTANVARIAARWHAAREARGADLRRIEGDATFDGQQRFLEVAARLAAERRLSRNAIHATRR